MTLTEAIRAAINTCGPEDHLVREWLQKCAAIHATRAQAAGRALRDSALAMLGDGEIIRTQAARIRALEDALKAADEIRKQYAMAWRDWWPNDDDLPDTIIDYDAARALTEPVRRKL